MARRHLRTIVITAVVLLAVGGTAFYATHAAAGARSASGIDADSVDRDAPGGDADAATADPTAVGYGPRAFTVAGHSVYIDTRKLHSPKPTPRGPRVESELADGVAHVGGAAVPTQTVQPAVAAPAPVVNAAGLDFNTWGDGHPPDTNGVVGPNHFVQSVNTSVGIFSKSTGALISAFTYNAFFDGSGTPACDTANGGDPTVAYDVPSGRWVIADFAWINSKKGPFYECVAVSSGSDPVAATWTFYSVPAGDGQFPDYPKFGSGPDGVYFTVNDFKGNSYTGAGVYAIRRTSLGTPTLQIQHVKTASSFFSLLPVNSVDPAPPPGPESIASVWNGQLSLWRFTVDWANAANTTFVNTANLPVSYTAVGRVKTPGEQVDSLSPRAMNKAQLRGGSLWLTQTIAAGTTSGVRWYEVTGLSGTPTIRQQSTFAPADNLYRWMPSLAVDKQGNMAIGYNAGNAAVNPAIRYAGRLAGDPLNTLGQSETSLIEGTGAPSSGNFNRWGDYSEMSVDPVDGCTFWFTGEYYATTGADWQTRIGSFKFPGCA